MGRDRGFTLIELAITLAIISITAAIVIGAAVAAKRNAGVAANAGELATRLQGQLTLALSEQRDRVVVVVDAANPSQCGFGADASCGHVWFLAPTSAWTISDFASGPSTNAAIIDSYSLGTGIKLDPTTQVAGPVPFDGVTTFDSETTTTCGGSLQCVAVRFGANGQVSSAYNGSTNVKSGLGLVLASDLQGQARAAVRYEVIVGFPTGIVKTLAF